MTPHMRHRTKVLIAVAVLGTMPLVGPILAQSAARPAAQVDLDTGHWPRFRGPNSNPVAENPNLPVIWSKTENVEWVTDVSTRTLARATR